MCPQIWQTVRVRGVGCLEVLAYSLPDLEALFEGLDVSKAQATLEQVWCKLHGMGWACHPLCAGMEGLGVFKAQAALAEVRSAAL